MTWLQDDRHSHEAIKLRDFKVLLINFSLNCSYAQAPCKCMSDFVVFFLVLVQAVPSVKWHRKGDYLCTVTPADMLFHCIVIVFVVFSFVIELCFERNGLFNLQNLK